MGVEGNHPSLLRYYWRSQHRRFAEKSSVTIWSWLVAVILHFSYDTLFYYAILIDFVYAMTILSYEPAHV